MVARSTSPLVVMFPDMPFTENTPGLLVVTYQEGADLAVDRQADLIARLEQQHGGAVLLFHVGPDVRSIPLDVPTFWLGITGRPELRIRGVVIVTQSMAVRVAARGFALANTARGVDMRVETFKQLSEALEWATHALAPARAE